VELGSWEVIRTGTIQAGELWTSLANFCFIDRVTRSAEDKEHEFVNMNNGMN
jgi:hypothetical protein